MIDIRNISVVKSGQKLFEDFSWRANDGEHWVITGPNGSGKTTLLESIAGAVNIQQGEILIDFVHGDTWEERYWDRKKKIKFIPAHAIQTLVRNNNELYYQQRYYGSDKEDALLVKDLFQNNVDKLATLTIPPNLDIQHLLSVEISRLSNGQLKKILLLQNLVGELPRMILLDYPFEGLDKNSRSDLNLFIEFVANTYTIQIILTDQHHDLPSIINRKMILNNFSIEARADVQRHQNQKTTSTPVLRQSQPAQPDGVDTIVEMINVKIQYSASVILNDFNWTVKRGERWALIGRNGSGKTTLFSLIFADHPMAYSQQIYLFGKRRGTGESIWDIKNRVCYIGPELINFLNPRYIMQSARQYIFNLNIKVNALSLNALVQYFEAAHFMDKPVRYLSSGQLQLMLIINALLTDKELLLLDEPFQFLDDKQRNLVSNYIQNHLRKNTTLILITHYDADIANWTALTMELR